MLQNKGKNSRREKREKNGKSGRVALLGLALGDMDLRLRGLWGASFRGFCGGLRGFSLVDNQAWRVTLFQSRAGHGEEKKSVCTCACQCHTHTDESSGEMITALQGAWP